MTVCAQISFLWEDEPNLVYRIIRKTVGICSSSPLQSPGWSCQRALLDSGRVSIQGQPLLSLLSSRRRSPRVGDGLGPLLPAPVVHGRGKHRSPPPHQRPEGDDCSVPGPGSAGIAPGAVCICTDGNLRQELATPLGVAHKLRAPGVGRTWMCNHWASSVQQCPRPTSDFSPGLMRQGGSSEKVGDTPTAPLVLSSSAPWGSDTGS